MPSPPAVRPGASFARVRPSRKPREAQPTGVRGVEAPSLDVAWLGLVFAMGLATAARDPKDFPPSGTPLDADDTRRIAHRIGLTAAKN